MTKGFYKYNQNNSDGGFDVDDKVCHRVIIEANSADEASTIALDLGIYFDGCSEGIDCSCCGDRWETVDKPIDLEKLANEGYKVSVYERSEGKEEAENRWNKHYGAYEVVKIPEWNLRNSTFRYSRDSFVGMLKFHNLEEYVQFLANEYRLVADHIIRIYYLNGNIKEIRPTR